MGDFTYQTVAVTVFPDRARVTRRGRATLASGLQMVVFRDLPLALIPDSVRVSGRGTATAKLLGVNARREYFAEAPAETVRDLERRIEEGDDKDAALAARLGVVESEKANLHALGAQAEMFARGLALRNRTPDEQMAIFAALAARAGVLDEAKHEINRDRRALARDLDRLRRELNALRNARPRERWIVVVELDCLAAGGLEIDLTYMVTDAGWKPLYDLRLGVGSLEVTYLAQVAQTTGEDWPGVSLTLSTAFPSLSLVIPELDPWYIEPHRPRPPMAAKAVAAPAAMRAASVAPTPAPPSQAVGAGFPEAQAAIEAEVALAEVSAPGAAVTYRVGGSTDVPGDGAPRKTTIAVFGLPPKLDYVTAPKLADAAYRRATIRNESPYMLLPGAAQLFEAEEYLGATALELTSPGQEFELVPGVDDRVRVKRELKAREVDKKFVGDRRRLRYAYEIELKNLLDSDQLIFVRDHVPVSRHEDIKIKLEFSDPKVTEHKELNLLEWKLTLGKGKKQTVRYEYSVEHPRAMEVRGLV